MREVVPAGPAAGFVGVLGLLAALDATVGLALPGWVVGVASAAALTALLAWGLLHASRRRLLPADRVTLTRAVLVCGVAALTVEAAAEATAAATQGAVTTALVVLSSVALALDAVDGWVARRTRTVTPLGARFDMEIDAVLILVLSVHVSRDLGWWVLCIGAARYVLLVLGAAALRAPWLRGQVPPRRWRKVVAAYQGIVLTVATGQAVPTALATAAVAVGLGLLVVSFGTEVATLWLRSARARRGTTTPYAVPSALLDGAVTQPLP